MTRELTKRTRSDGERSRAAILRAAVADASVHGLEGLSIGALATRLGVSKSGLFAHFGSKEQLQLATVRAAAQVFDREVLDRASAAPEGVARLVALTEAYLSYLERRVFPGGCFFLAASFELDSRPGPVRDAVLAAQGRLYDEVVASAERARGLGEIGPEADARQIAFEVTSLLAGANAWLVGRDDAASLDRARTGIESILIRAARPRSALPDPRT